MKVRQLIPHLLTLGNLVCGGIVAVEIARKGYANPVVVLLFVAGFFDLLDGAVARALKVSGELGKQLDSLADVISFGLAPSVIVFSMLENSLPIQWQWVKYIAFLNVICAAWRLAKFNISTDQTADFTGMPSPANGLFWASIALLSWKWSVDDVSIHFLFTVMPVFALLILTSFLMVSSIKMFSFKFKPGGFKTNRIAYVYIGCIFIMPFVVWLLGQPFLLTIPVALVLYMVFSFGYHYSLRKG